jgi:hypothetical protein
LKEELLRSTPMRLDSIEAQADSTGIVLAAQ